MVNSERFFSNMVEEFNRIVTFLGLPTWELTRERNANPAKYSPMKPETRKKLREFFKPHNQRLYELLDDDFGWQ